MTYGDNLSDEALMGDFARGEQKAFELLYKRLSPKVYGYLRLRLNNREDIDEVFQKVFSKLLATRARYDATYPVLQWVFVMTRSAMLDHLKSSKRKQKLVDELKNSDLLSQNTNDPSLPVQMEQSLLKNLSREAQEVVTMRVIDELGFDQIATRLGKSEAGVRQILSRSLKKLRFSFGDSK